MGDLLKSEIKKDYKKKIFIFGGLVFLFFLLFYNQIDGFVIDFFSSEEFLAREEICFVERVIDGDTIVACNQTVRMLGINAPEKGERFSIEAKEYLSKRIENKSVTLKFSEEKYDKYKRILAYVYLDDECINSRLIENGLANPYFPSKKDKNFKKFFDSWNVCLERKKGICTHSKNACSKCIVLEELDFIEERVVLRNICGFQCNISGWSIKDEGRKLFFFDEFYLNPGNIVKIIVSNKTNKKVNELIWKRNDNVWTDSGDTLFLRDSEGDLVLWRNYF